MGTCVYTCETGWGDCTAAPGCETDLGTTKAHCGACGNACIAFCKAGSCNDPVSVAGGYYHHCAVLKDGEVYCWGRNETGELGDGSKVSKTQPVKIALPGGLTAIDVSANGRSAGSYSARTCAVLKNGTVACWGENVLTPTLVGQLANIKSISVGGGHVCAVDVVGGALYCWGRNQSGQVGIGDTFFVQFPTKIASVSDVVKVSAGSTHTCALQMGGKVFCWGRNFNGQLGLGDTTDRLTPTAVSALSGVTNIQIGDSHTCSLGSTGLHCWGSNQVGSLGINSYIDASTPQFVSLLGAQRIDLGYGNTGATVDGALWMWGNNASGQLGNGNQTNQPKPIVNNLTGVSSLAFSVSTSCALMDTGEILCWGNNTYGQFGNGTTASSFTPTPLVWP
ncbi:RCC1 domain-containing protein [Polyangium jinanense]|uniref:RCC1 domain-containing protein n=2 Tax=Polyangium jinanense TaxID=2829994 RepID=UPI00234142A5|nr:hypothetical protein [Polyangium jinanense]